MSASNKDASVSSATSVDVTITINTKRNKTIPSTSPSKPVTASNVKFSLMSDHLNLNPLPHFSSEDVSNVDISSSHSALTAFANPDEVFSDNGNSHSLGVGNVSNTPHTVGFETKSNANVLGVGIGSSVTNEVHLVSTVLSPCTNKFSTSFSETPPVSISNAVPDEHFCDADQGEMMTAPQPPTLQELIEAELSSRFSNISSDVEVEPDSLELPPLPRSVDSEEKFEDFPEIAMELVDQPLPDALIHHSDSLCEGSLTTSPFSIDSFYEESVIESDIGLCKNENISSSPHDGISANEQKKNKSPDVESKISLEESNECQEMSKDKSEEPVIAGQTLKRSIEDLGNLPEEKKRLTALTSDFPQGTPAVFQDNSAPSLADLPIDVEDDGHFESPLLSDDEEHYESPILSDDDEQYESPIVNDDDEHCDDSPLDPMSLSASPNKHVSCSTVVS